MKRVDFFIVGAMRSGTSSLRDALSRNRHINMALREPMFFSNDGLFGQGLDHYHALFDWDQDYSARGEKSPRYAISPTAPQRVHEYNPQAKIVWTLRDPVKRAVSHYQHSSFRTEDALSLSEAIRNSEVLEANNSTMAYVYRSEYHKHIRAWLRCFPKEQHHFIILEEMIARPTEVLRELHTFLGVPWDDAVELPHSKNKKMSSFTEKLSIRDDDIDRLRQLLTPTYGAMEEILGRRITAWERLSYAI